MPVLPSLMVGFLLGAINDHLDARIPFILGYLRPLRRHQFPSFGQPVSIFRCSRFIGALWGCHGGDSCSRNLGFIGGVWRKIAQVALMS